MALNSWLTSLKNGGTGVSGGTSLIYNGFSGNPTQKSGVTRVTNQPDNPAPVTPVTRENGAGLPEKCNEINEVTTITPVTHEIIITAVNAANQRLNSECLTQPPETMSRWTWPDGDGWNEAEIARLIYRQEHFERQGLPTDEAEVLAERMLMRDRDAADDRHACVECRHCITGRCANSAKAGFVRGSAVGDLSVALHRCDGYAAGDGTLAPRATAPASPPKRGSLGHPLSDATRQASIDYLAHHWKCRQCQAAGLGYGERCQSGLALWAAYHEGATS